MKFDDLIVLIPCHSLEDFPIDLPSEKAAGLLNAYQVAWHPLLLAACGRMPRWHRADEPPKVVKNRLFFIPPASESWVPAGWPAKAEMDGATLLRGEPPFDKTCDRAKLIDAALRLLAQDSATREGEAPAEPVAATLPDTVQPQTPTTVDPDIAADFLALGFTYLQLHLLTRQMRHLSNLDEVRLQRETLAAARAAATDPDTARGHLRRAFEALHEGRERFYPVDDYLLDLCLVLPDMAGDPLRRRLRATHPPTASPSPPLGGEGRGEGAVPAPTAQTCTTTAQPPTPAPPRKPPTPLIVLLSGETLDRLAAEEPDTVAALREACAAGRAEILGGDYRERISTLLPLESILYNFRRAAETYQRHLAATPLVYGRKRFGLFAALPSILVKHGYTGAWHLALDDGAYPEDEKSKILWEGPDGSRLPAVTSIPLAADSAGTYLRLPARLAETMKNDMVATLGLAHWPDVHAPWYDDLLRMARYAPVLGRFMTLGDYFRITNTPARPSQLQPDAYRSPFLVQAVARKDADFLSGLADHWQRRIRFQSMRILAMLDALASARAPSSCRALEDRIEAALQPERAADSRRDESGVLPYSETPETVSPVPPEGSPSYEPRAAPFPAEAPIGDIRPEPAAAGARPADENTAVPTAQSPPDPDAELEARIHAAARNLAALIAPSPTDSATATASGAGVPPVPAGRRGYLIVNPLSFPRRVAVDLPELAGELPREPPVLASQADAKRRCAVVEVPGFGFAWVPREGAAHPGPAPRAGTTRGLLGLFRRKPPPAPPSMIEGFTLRSDCLEVTIDEQTGAIRSIATPDLEFERIGQQIAFRFAAARRSRLPGGTSRHRAGREAAEDLTHYTRMVAEKIARVADGPALAEVVSRGKLIDPQTEDPVAGFEQRVRIWMGRRIVELEITLDPFKLPDRDPWNSYYCARFAWLDAHAAISRSILWSTYPTGSERIESPLFVEIASTGKRASLHETGLLGRVGSSAAGRPWRATILTGGLAMHRRTGSGSDGLVGGAARRAGSAGSSGSSGTGVSPVSSSRMLDTLLIVPGETRRTFRLGIAIDHDDPVQAALDFMAPVALAPTDAPPSTGPTGWLFHLDAPNVIVTDMGPMSEWISSPPYEGGAGGGSGRGEGETQRGGDAPRGTGGEGETGASGFWLRLAETDGRAVRTRLRCFRPPTSAEQLDFRGRPLNQLATDDDDVLIDLAAHEVVQVAIRL